MSLLLLFLQQVLSANSLKVEAQIVPVGTLPNTGGWTDISADVLRVPSIAISYGINGAGPLDLVAETGTMTFALNNGPGNSANLLGYYSPEHANCRTDWRVGTNVRFRYTIGATTYCKFVGRIESIDPVSGQYGDRIVLCTAVDWMDAAAIYHPNVATQVSKRSDEILSSIVGSMFDQPFSSSYATGTTTFPYALDSDANESDTVLTVLQRLAQSDYFRIYIVGDTGTGGQLKADNRTTRLSTATVASFNDTMVALSGPHQRGLIVNKVKATPHPRTVDAAATTVLFTLAQVNPSIHTVQPGETVVIEGDYTDPTLRASRVGGTDMVVPVATTDYTMNSSADGTGADQTPGFTVSATYGANRVSYSITNGNLGVAYITKLQARGRGLYDYGAVDIISSDTTSISTYGERQLVLDMPYQSSVVDAEAVGDYILNVFDTAAPIAATMQFAPKTNTDLATALSLEPGMAISVMETATGIADTFFINHVSFRVESNYIFYFEWILQRALVESFWDLEVAGASELESTTFIAPG